jgi:hypothetical protein
MSGFVALVFKPGKQSAQGELATDGENQSL